MSNPGQPPADAPRPDAPRSGGVPPSQLPTETERTVGILAHLSALIAAVLSAGWLSILGPLVIYLLYRERSPLVRTAAAGAFNFNLAIWAMIVLGWILLFTVILVPLAIIVWLVAGITGLVCHILGAVRASHGEPYRYPFGIRVLS